MRIVILCGVLVHIALFSHEHKPSLRTLIVYDSLTPDLKVAAAADVARVHEALGCAAGQAGLIFRPQVLTVDTFSPKTFQKWLKRIHSKSGDVAFFYYAGRGVNRSHQKWPSISFGRKKLISEKGVTRRVRSYKPDLAVVVFDCYGKSVTSQDGVDFNQIRKVEMSQLDARPGFNNLFRKHKGWIMWCSGEKAQNSFYSSQQQPFGGLFTSNILRALFSYGKVQDISWVHVAHCASRLSSDVHINFPPLLDVHFTRVPEVLIR